MAKFMQLLAASNLAHYTGAGINYTVQTPSGALYCVYVDSNTDVVFTKTTDGLNWSTPTTIFTGTVTALSIWYDRWSNISAGLIHCAYVENVNDDVLYRSIDTESSDGLSSETTIFAGASAVTGGCLSITRARGGNLYCHAVIDAGAEGGFFRSTDVGATWGSRTVNEAIATTDQIIMLPGWAADNQDAMAFFWDASADEISRYLYDDSANSWAETSIAATMLDVVATTHFPHFAAAVDITNSRNLLVAWSAVDAANQDLRCWHVTESAITEVTEVVLNATDDCGFAAIGIDTATQDWYVFYGGKSDGTDVVATALTLNYKSSTDDGATWGSETPVVEGRFGIVNLNCTPRFNTAHAVMMIGPTSVAANVFVVADKPIYTGARPTYVLGI